MRYKIDIHDYNVRIKNTKKFIEAGNKVKVVIMLRGREMQHKALAFELMERFKNDISEFKCTIEKEPGMEGSNLVMILTP